MPHQRQGVTLVVKSRWSISNAIGVRVTGGMDSIPLDFKHRRQDRYPARFRLHHQSRS
jgi:hypothetical protein